MNNFHVKQRGKSMNYQVMQTFITLLLRDARTFQRHILNRMIDACVWSGSSLYVSQYLLPLFGIDLKFASFLVLGNLVVWPIFEVGNNMSVLLGDLYSNNSLSYYLSLPIPSSLIFIRIALTDAYKSFMATVPLLFFSKLILLDHFSMSAIHYPKMIFCWIMAHILFGFFGVFASSITDSFENIPTIRQRILFPMWFLGCYQFTWSMLYTANPTIAYIDLLNPVVYVLEGMRGSIDTGQPTIPFHFCVFAMIFFTVFFAWLGIRQFKKRLDCI
jgi:ABC-2 type transport system permease protein